MESVPRFWETKEMFHTQEEFRTLDRPEKNLPCHIVIKTLIYGTKISIPNIAKEKHRAT